MEASDQRPAGVDCQSLDPACRLTRARSQLTTLRRSNARVSAHSKGRHGLQPQSERQRAQRGCRRRYAALVGTARRARHDRDEIRLRPGALRRLHRAPRRRTDALLRDSGRGSRGEGRHDHRGDRQDCCRSRDTAGLACARSAAMRLLPVGTDHVRDRTPAVQPAAVGGRHRPGHGREHLPLRHLSAHPRGHQARLAFAREKEIVMNPSRRRFLQSSGALSLAFYLPGAVKAAGAEASFAPNAYLRIAPSGEVTIICAYVEMGQGTYTSIPMLIAEELEGLLSSVRVEHAPPDERYYANPLLGVQATGNSNAIRGAWEPMRRAGAVARTMLIQAAAQRWKVDPASCRAENGAVLHPATGRRSKYGALVADAAKLPVPAPDSVKLKPRSEFKLIGTPAKRLDIAGKVNGGAQFGIDAKVKGMKIATIAISPVLGGRLRSVDDAAAKAVRGVRQVVRLEDAVAVVADHMGAAKKGLAALKIEWDEGVNATLSTADLLRDADEASTRPGAVARQEGDIAKALGAAATRVDAVYRVPFFAHAPMEPMNATVHVRKDSCEVWTGTQVMTRVQVAAAKLT